MLGLIQRVNSASISIENSIVSSIDKGLLLFLAVQRNDSNQQASKLLNKILNYRIFPDQDRRMNKSLLTIQADLLVVSQFTLAASTTKGLRPSFSSAAKPDEAKKSYDYFLSLCDHVYPNYKSGVFGADMQINLINDGPVTFMFET